MRRLLGVIMLLLAGGVSAQQRPPLSIVMTVGNSSPYVGEITELTIQAFDSTSTQGLEISLPDLDGFGQMPAGDTLAGTQVLEGIPYNVYTRKIRLFPNRAGTFVIEPAALRAPETPFISAAIYRSNQLAITVLPLPAGAPPDFSNAVGDFTLTATLSAETIAANEAITMTFTLTGSGNLSRLQPPMLTPPAADWRSLPARSQLKGDEAGGSLTIQQILLPQRSGSLQLSDLSWSYFDPLARQYVTLTTPPFTVTVGAGLASASPQPTVTELAETPVLDLKAVTGQTLRAALPYLWPDILWWLILPAVVGLIWLVARLKHLSVPTLRRPSVPPPARLRRQLAQAMSLPPAQAFGVIDSVILAAIQQRATGARQTIDEWLDALPPEFKTKLDQARRTASSARFAPATAEDIRRFAQEVYSLIRQIDHQSEES